MYAWFLAQSSMGNTHAKRSDWSLRASGTASLEKIKREKRGGGEDGGET